jgi:hypothetical protein
MLRQADEFGAKVSIISTMASPPLPTMHVYEASANGVAPVWGPIRSLQVTAFAKGVAFLPVLEKGSVLNRFRPISRFWQVCHCAAVCSHRENFTPIPL